MDVGVTGAGHVGHPTAATLAHVGHEVTVTDADQETIDLMDGRNVFDPEVMARHRSPTSPPGRPPVRQ